MKRSKRRISTERRRVERDTLQKLAAAGASPAELARCQWLLTKGRKDRGDDYCDVLNKNSQEKTGIEFFLRSLRGDPPDYIIFNHRPVPATSYHG